MASKLVVPKETCVALIKEHFLKRFGVAEDILNHYRFFFRGNAIWMTGANPLPPWSEEKIQRLGIRLLRNTGKGWKPSTPALQLLSRFVTANRVDVTVSEWLTLITGDSVVPAQASRDQLSPGYVALCFKGEVVACGYFEKGRLVLATSRQGVQSLSSIFERFRSARAEDE